MSNLALANPSIAPRSAGTAQASTPIRIPASRPRKTNHLSAVAPKVEARGFALYIGITEQEAAEHGITLRQLSAELRKTLERLAPKAESHAVVALAPQDVGGSNIEVVRTALQDPARLGNASSEKSEPAGPKGVTIDTTRHQVLLDGEAAPFSYREFELLKYFVVREGQTITREELIRDLWPVRSADGSDLPSGRTIDVHIRRLRVKLGRYENIVQTVRGAGYRFDLHADVRVVAPAGPSPDRF